MKIKKLLCYSTPCWKKFATEKGRLAHCRIKHPEVYRRIMEKKNDK